MTFFGMRGWGLSPLLLILAGSNPGLRADAAAPLTAEQRQELEKQIATKENDAAKAEEAEDFNPARQLRKDILVLATRRYGAKDWHVTDARLALVQVDVLTKLNAKQRAQLREATALDRRGEQLDDKGKYREAELLLRQSLLTRQQVLGEDHPDTATSYNNVAVNLDAQGRYAEAEPLKRKALAIRLRLLGETHPDTANSYNNLAFNLNAQGKYAEVESLYRKALAILQTVHGEDHPDTATCYNNVAVHLEAQGKYAEAEALKRKSLAICLKVLGEEHLTTALTYNNLAINLDAQGKYAEAEPLYRKALSVWQKVLGEDHPTTATGYNNVAVNLDAQGRYAEAEPLKRKALAIRRKVLGEDHPDTAVSYSNVAFNLDAQGKHAEAEPLVRKALAIQQKVLGEDHPDTATGYNNVAVNLDAQGKYAEAEPLKRKALLIRQKLLGEYHPDTAISYNNVAINLAAQGKYAEAEPLVRKALAIMEKVLGEDHPSTATGYNNVAVNLDNQGKYAEAELLKRRALAIRQKMLGENHPDTAISYNNVAVNLIAQGRYAEAEPLFRKALAIHQKALGQDHPITVQLYNNLAFTLNALGKYAEAIPMARTAAAHFQNVRHQATFSGLDRTTFTTERSPWPLLAALLARSGQPADAWHALEANLAQGLLDDLDAQRRPLNADERRRLDDLHGRIDQHEKQHDALASLKNPTPEQQGRREALRRERDRLKADLAQTQADLRQKYGAAAGQVYELPRLQQQLPSDAAILSWLDLKAGLKERDPQGDHWACLIRASGPPVWVRLAGGGLHGAWTPADDALPGDLRKQLQKPSQDPAWHDPAQRLAAQRLAPLEEYLRGEGGRPAVKHLIILPAVSMAGIPLETLTDRYSVSYAPSGTLFAYLQEQHRTPATGTLLALGDPVFPSAAAPATRPTPPEHGVVLAGVTPGTNANRAGIQSGDVLLSYAETRLTNMEDLKKAIANQASDPSITRVPVELWRDGQVQTVQVRPGALGVTLSPQPPVLALRARWEGEDTVRRSLRSGSFVPLPGTRREVEAIARLFQQRKLLLGSEASEPALDALVQANQLKQYRYLHLATHGRANSDHGMHSFLALAQDRLPDPLTIPPLGQKHFDGRLTAADIVRSWALEADLVTLSACETGLGQQQGGEGYVGFAQALFLAGARSLVFSQWKVDDDATALLMVRFYQNLLGKRPGLEAPLGKAAALAEAKAWLRQLEAAEVRQLKADLRQTSRGSEEARPAEGIETTPGDHPYQHPYYWASFILVGDPGDLAQVRPVLGETTSTELASIDGQRRWWPWLLAGAGVAVGLALGLVWWQRRRRLRA